MFLGSYLLELVFYTNRVNWYIFIIRLKIFFKAWALWADAFCKSICPSVCLSVYPLSVPFKRLFAPTSQGWMSNIFKDSESLGKSNGRKWSQIWTSLFGSGLKLLNKKKIVFFSGWFCLTKHGGNPTSWWNRDLWSKVISLILAYF